LGKAVEQLREEKGLTQEELGSVVDRDHKFAGEIERGQHDFRFMTLVLMASALETSPGRIVSLADRFLAGAEPESSPGDV
jgi:transcriptional regulator with XRE-family HTH domain